MTSTDFFDNLGGTGVPSALLAHTDDFIVGDIVEMFTRGYVPFGQKEVEKRDDGTDKQQLVIVLQTELRNWQNVVKVPKVDPTDENSAPKPASEDDGKRAVYVPEGKNIQFAIARALRAAQAKPEVGGKLGVKVANERDTGKGNPLKEHEAVYTPPSAGGSFFESGSQPVQQAPAQAYPAPQQAPAQAYPAPQQAPAQAVQPPIANDPWSGQPVQQAAPAASKPPF